MAFKDLNRDGAKQMDEEPLVDKYVYLFDTAGNYVRNARTDTAGSYRMEGVAPGTYRVEYGLVEWWELWREWAPSTTGSIRPRVTVELGDSTTVNFGWRPIERSSDLDAPVSSFTAPSGLVVHSYNDVVSARDVYDALMQGSLHGDEAASTTIRFDSGSGDFCRSSVVQVGGRYQDFVAGCSVDYLRWLESGDQYLFHEYGHAWSLYHAYIVQQDPAMLGYLAARGIDPDDPRLDTTHAWNTYEMLAEDYRTLFGSPTARAASQENDEIPASADVPGLPQYLSTTFMTPPASPPPEAVVTTRVGDLDGSAAAGTRTWTATVHVGVEDGLGQPVEGATVTLGVPTGKQAKTLTCTTGPDGRCAAALSLPTRTRSATFTVTDVAKSDTTYMAEANGDAEGDSDGTAVVVAKPGG